MMIRGQQCYSPDTECQTQRLLATLKAKNDRDSMKMLHNVILEAGHKM